MTKKTVFVASALAVLLIGATSTAWTEGKADTKAPAPATGAKGGEVALTATPLPISSTPITLTVFASMSSSTSGVIKNYNELEVFKHLEKISNIKIEWLHPAASQVKEQFNLMIASGKLPDMVYSNWTTYPGGPEKAMEDGILSDITKPMTLWAPEMQKIFKDKPEVRKQMTTDSGKFFAFPRLNSSPETSTGSNGLQIRKDWLDKLGLKVPTTIDEWYVVLKAFKEKDPNGNGKADEIPFGYNSVINIVRPWGMEYGFYKKGTTVKYGPIEPGFKGYLTTFSKWYKEGLIDVDYLVSDTKSFKAKVMSGLMGSYYGSYNNQNEFMDLMAEKDPKFKVVFVPWPKGPEGISYINTDHDRWAYSEGLGITSKNKFVKESTLWADIQYSKEFTLRHNWGIEGVTYTLGKDGKPAFTDLVLNNPNKLTIGQVISKYGIGGTWACWWDKYVEYHIRSKTEGGLEVYTTWGVGDATLRLPSSGMTPTPAESNRMAEILPSIQTYVDEMTAKFIIGREPIENYEKFVQTIKGMGIDEAIKIQQASYDRYLKR